MGNQKTAPGDILKRPAPPGRIEPVPLREALGAWYRQRGRPLPWRLEPSLYRTVVSEFMCQQTQIATVLPYFARWMEELPDFEALAAAAESRVLRLWEGLGYYSRARNLHRLARAVAACPGGPPRTASGWLELPGIGPYTAAAIASLACGQAVACVDGNVVRILARLTADRTGFRDGAAAARAFGPLAQTLMDGAGRPGEHNQAMMELGALVCTRRSPDCPGCPVSAWCGARRLGSPEEFPRLERRAVERRRVTRIWWLRDGALLLRRTPEAARRLAGLHELPTAAEAGLDEEAAEEGELLLKRTRAITHHHITETIRRVGAAQPRRAPGGPPRAASAKAEEQDGPDTGPGAGPDLVWVPLGALDGVSLSGPHRRWVREILSRSGP